MKLFLLIFVLLLKINILTAQITDNLKYTTGKNLKILDANNTTFDEKMITCGTTGPCVNKYGVQYQMILYGESAATYTPDWETCQTECYGKGFAWMWVDLPGSPIICACYNSGLGSNGVVAAVTYYNIMSGFYFDLSNSYGPACGSILLTEMYFTGPVLAAPSGITSNTACAMACATYHTPVWSYIPGDNPSCTCQSDDYSTSYYEIAFDSNTASCGYNVYF